MLGGAASIDLCDVTIAGFKGKKSLVDHFHATRLACHILMLPIRSFFIDAFQLVRFALG